MKRLITGISILAFAILVFGVGQSSAQWGGIWGNPDYRDGRYYPNYGNLRSRVDGLKYRARQFEQLTNRLEDNRDDRDDRGWGWGNWGNWNRGNRRDYGRLEDLGDDFKKAAEKFADKFGNGRNLNNSRDAAYRLLEIGREIDNEIRRGRYNSQVRNLWTQIRYDLDEVARVYNYGYNRPGW
ncbi:MAG TPA: hypothetical protein VNK26_03695 [Pyrinomonadaceae bacterium]|nr:hypothetical protein [Pyrinomonadaceae bacterium]